MHVATLRLVSLAAARSWRRAPPGRSSRPEAEAHFNIGLTHLREGRTDAGARGVQEGDQAGPQERLLPQGRSASPTADCASTGDADGRASRRRCELNPYYVDVRNDLGTALMLVRQARGGQGGAAGGLQRPHQSHAPRSPPATWARPTSRRRTTRRRELVPHRAAQQEPGGLLGLPTLWRGPPQDASRTRDRGSVGSTVQLPGQSRLRRGRTRARVLEEAARDPGADAARASAGDFPCRRPVCPPAMLDAVLGARRRARCSSTAKVVVGGASAVARLIGAYQGSPWPARRIGAAHGGAVDPAAATRGSLSCSR